MLRAIRQHARVLVEARCYHIETRSKLMPSRITEDMKRRMPVP
jgi:hypothetical protein